MAYICRICKQNINVDDLVKLGFNNGMLAYHKDCLYPILADKIYQIFKYDSSSRKTCRK